MDTAPFWPGSVTRLEPTYEGLKPEWIRRGGWVSRMFGAYL